MKNIIFQTLTLQKWTYRWVGCYLGKVIFRTISIWRNIFYLLNLREVVGKLPCMVICIWFYVGSVNVHLCSSTNLNKSHQQIKRSWVSCRGFLLHSVCATISSFELMFPCDVQLYSDLPRKVIYWMLQCLQMKCLKIPLITAFDFSLSLEFLNIVCFHQVRLI